MTKFELVNMFGELSVPNCTAQRIYEEYRDWDSYEQMFYWNGTSVQITLEKRRYPELTPDLVRELCASFILEKIGKSIEVQL